MAAGVSTTDYFTFTPNVSSEPLTISCWLYAATLNNRTILSVFNGANYHRLMYLTTAGTALARSRAGGTFASAQQAGLTAAAWHHVVGVWTSSTSRQVFIDGSGGAVDTTSKTVGSVTSGDVATVINGGHTIADVSIWDVALTQDEITSLSKGFSGSLIRPASLQFHAPLIRNRLNVAGQSVSESGTITVEDHPPIIGAIAA